MIDNKTLGPGDTFGVQFVAGDSVGPGHWMLHCHMQFHSDMGMSTTMHVLDENGAMPPHGGPMPTAPGQPAPAQANPAQPAPAQANPGQPAHTNHR